MSGLRFDRALLLMVSKAFLGWIVFEMAFASFLEGMF